MSRPLPPLVLRVLRARLSRRLFEEVAGDLEERWRGDAAVSSFRAWRGLLRTACSVLWHTALEDARRWRRRHSIDSDPSLKKGDGMLTAFLQDLRFALRLGVRQPWLSAAAVLTLALGIGATTAIFSVMHAWILEPLPYRDPSRLVVLWETIPSASIFSNTPAPATVTAWTQRATAFDGIAAWTTDVLGLTDAGEPARLLAAQASPDILTVLGVSPALGRNFTSEEAAPNGPRAAILTHTLWVTRFGGRRDIIGERITLSGEPTTVVGVLPPRVELLHLAVDVWVPLRFGASEWNSGNRILWVVGRLAPGASVERAAADVDGIMRELSDGTLGARAVPLHDEMVGPLGRDVAVLFGATAIVLLIACANVASLTLARVSGRRQELIVRAALGAGRGRIVRQVLTESLALGTAGAIVGVLLASWGVRAVVALAPQSAQMPGVTVVSPVILLFAFTSATLTALLFGIVPASRSASVQIGTGLRDGAMSFAAGRKRLLRTLVAAEVALALVLFAAAGLVLRSYQKLSVVDLGFETRDVIAVDVSRNRADGALSFYEALLDRLNDAPGVSSAALTQALPLRSSCCGANFRIEGRTDDGSAILSYWRTVTPRYFETLSIPLLQGRAFDVRDREGSGRVAIVSASFANRAWSGGSPLGRRIGWGTLDQPLTVIGVVADVRLSPAAEPVPHVYMPFTQVPSRMPGDLVVRSSAGTAAVVDLIRRATWEIDPSQPVARIATMDGVRDRTMGRRRFHLVMFTIAAAMAVGLALVGIYGVLAYAATQMAPELGLRLALGSTRGALVLLVMRLGLAPTLVGIAVGAAVSWWSAGVMRGFLFGVEPRDPATFAAVALTLVVVAAGACIMPGWRAALVDPLKTIRSQ